jgi:hypothetical protein
MLKVFNPSTINEAIKNFLTHSLTSMKLAIIFLVIVPLIEISESVRVFKQWTLMDIHFPNNNVRQRAISDGTFIAKNILPIDVDVDFKGAVAFLIK